MSTIIIQHSTGFAHADRTVQSIVTLFEAVFPERIAGYYVEGSYADGTAVATSDLDLIIVFRGNFATVAEQELAQQMVSVCGDLSALELDAVVVEESRLHQHATPMFKLGARLLYGRDIRDTIPLLPIELWARKRMHAAYWLTVNVFHRPKPVRVPISFPQPDAPFYGYTARTMRLAGGVEIPTTRDLIRVTGWIATARIAFEASQYVVRKRDCVPIYREMISDEWTELLEQIDQRCRTDWSYCIPPTEAEREELRLILEGTLAFENHFLMFYREFLLTELVKGDSIAKQDALRVLKMTFYADPVIVQAIQNLMNSSDPAIQAAVQRLGL